MIQGSTSYVPAAVPPDATAAPTLGTSRLAAMMGVAAVLGPACVALYVVAGSPAADAPAVALVLGLTAWIAHPSAARASVRDAGRPSAFELYIATIVALLGQAAEEWLAHLPATVVRLFPGAYPTGVTYDERIMVAVFPMVGSALFLFGALAFYGRRPVGEGAAWLLFVWALVSAALPFAYAAAGRDLHYVGGMATAPVVAACGAWGLHRLRAAARAARSAEGRRS